MVNHVPRGSPTVFVLVHLQMALLGLVIIALQEHYILVFIMHQAEIELGLIVVTICMYQHRAVEFMIIILWLYQKVVTFWRLQ